MSLLLQKVQRFAAKSEKQPFQISLFDEAELECAIDDLIDDIPEDSLSQELVQTAYFGAFRIAISV